MEKFILTSQNLKDKKRQGKGSFSLFSRLEQIADFDCVFIEADLPDFELQLNWEECFTPQLMNLAFMPLISPKLYTFKFQYLGNFSKFEKALELGDEGELGFSEFFEAVMSEKQVFKSIVSQSEFCNCSWLVEFLFQSEKICSDPTRTERLIWQQVSDGYEIVLESEQNSKKLTERQVFLFQNNFETVSWQHIVCVR